jgi:hypothetical protein
MARDGPVAGSERVVSGAYVPSEAEVEAAGEAIEDAALRYLGRDVGTLHRDDIAHAALVAAHAVAPAPREDLAEQITQLLIDDGWHGHPDQLTMHNLQQIADLVARSFAAPAPETVDTVPAAALRELVDEAAYVGALDNHVVSAEALRALLPEGQS